MKLNRTDTGRWDVWEAPIRKHDWQLIRKSGVGTYAVIAGKTDDDPDEQVVIEEYADPENRQRWDLMPAGALARLVYQELQTIDQPEYPKEVK